MLSDNVIASNPLRLLGNTLSMELRSRVFSILEQVARGSNTTRATSSSPTGGASCESRTEIRAKALTLQEVQRFVKSSLCVTMCHFVHSGFQ